MDINSVIRSGFILLGGVVIYFVVGKIIRRIIAGAVNSGRHPKSDPSDAKKRTETLNGLFRTIWKVTIVAITTATILRNLFPTIDLSPLFASAGIIGVALGFGAQSLVKDLLSGIFIISDNQYRVGDVVAIDEATGTVERIGARSTVLRDVDGNVHYIPNGIIQHVINKTMGYSVTRFNIAVDPTSDIDQLIEIINSTGQKITDAEKWKTKILEPPKFSHIDAITGTYITVVISGKTQPSEQWSVTAEMRRRLLVELEKANIKLAKQTLRTR
jgi:small-conductance mechanosensitive channel